MAIFAAAGAFFKGLKLTGKLIAAGILLAIVVGVPTYTYFHGKDVGREELLLELADARGDETKEQVRENVKEAQKAITAIEDTKKDLKEQQEKFNETVDANGDCSCEFTDDELREYNEIVKRGGGGMR
jgi:hypothetical protein